MLRQKWNWVLGATLMFVLAFSWNVSVRTAPPKALDWVKLNPAFAGAKFVNDAETCRTCHESSMTTYGDTKHAHVIAAKAATGVGECETCHGPRSKHLEDADATLKLATPQAESAVCLQCHEGGARMGWKSGPHQAGDVSCSSCHSVMAPKSDRAMLSKAKTAELCVTCHADVKGDLNKMSHHPVKEGRMDCASCHNTHGSTPGLLIKATVNDTCFTCHADKRGPFVWEHAPVRESCDTCHTPHGSNQRALLTQKDPFLCLSCHSYGGHINLPRYNRTSNSYGSGCTNCHITTHGSNHPSGAKFTR